MPGGTVCSVATCKSNSKKCREKGENLMFFRFPKDSEIQKEWVRKCARKDKWNPIEKRLCSKHFKPDDYEDEMQARLLNLQPKMLKKDAIPSHKLQFEEKIMVAFKDFLTSNQVEIALKEPIFFFADVLHRLKLLRNWFIDTGFILPGDKKLDKLPVKRLIENMRSEINSCYKLTPKHLNNYEETQRQNVKLAAQPVFEYNVYSPNVHY